MNCQFHSFRHPCVISAERDQLTNTFPEMQSSIYQQRNKTTPSIGNEAKQF